MNSQGANCMNDDSFNCITIDNDATYALEDSNSKPKIIEMVVETTRMFMRRPITNDFSLENLWRNEKVREFLGGIVSDDLISQKISALQNHWNLHQFGQWAVFEKSSNEIAGLCGLHYSEDGTEISYMFFPNYWGQGFAREAVIESINYGFKTLQLEKVIAITQAANTKSCRLLNQIGMNHTNSFERYDALQCLYELTRSEWQIKSII